MVHEHHEHHLRKEFAHAMEAVLHHLQTYGVDEFKEAAGIAAAIAGIMTANPLAAAGGLAEILEGAQDLRRDFREEHAHDAAEATDRPHTPGNVPSARPILPGPMVPP
jgi:hypothetical protein